jgi:hypothetical protein
MYESRIGKDFEGRFSDPVCGNIPEGLRKCTKNGRLVTRPVSNPEHPEYETAFGDVSTVCLHVYRYILTVKVHLQEDYYRIRRGSLK